MPVKLTVGAIENMMNHRDVKDPFLQILSPKIYSGSNSTFLLSDGKHFCVASVNEVMISKELISQLNEFAVVCVEEYVIIPINLVSKTQQVILNGLYIAEEGNNARGKIGLPTYWETIIYDTARNAIPSCPFSSSKDVKETQTIKDCNEAANKTIQQQEEIDADDYFGKTVALTLKKIGKIKKNSMIKTKIMKILEEAECDEGEDNVEREDNAERGPNFRRESNFKRKSNFGREYNVEYDTYFDDSW